MKPILGTNRFSDVKQSAKVLAETPAPNPEPLLVSMDVGQGRSIAYGGDTWVWYRSSEESRLAHRKFWRQVVFWLSHKENEGDNQVKVKLDRRRMAVGEKIDLTVTARDAKGASIPNVKYEGRVEREKADPPISHLMEVYNQGEEGKGPIYATEKVGQPGTYAVTVVAKRDDEEIGRDTARFLVYQDDRELENPVRRPRAWPARSPGSPTAKRSRPSDWATTSRDSTDRVIPSTSPPRSTGSGTTGRSS